MLPLKSICSMALAALWMGMSVQAAAHDRYYGGDAVVGGAIGGGAGAAIGSAVGGRDGAIIGGAIGAATGVAITGPSRIHYGPGYGPVYRSSHYYYYEAPRYRHPGYRHPGWRGHGKPHKHHHHDHHHRHYR
ncbi:hypothetical protein [Pseudomethylobacillus aquaticus]|nr:hypothetical protein [Pseudomethylobacillus aquaticus]